ncbi:MAG: GNAT family N-acetyltransferase, partial [Nannocystaceae bacterium]
QRIVRANDWVEHELPRVHLGRTSAGNTWRFRSDLPDELVADLEALCREEPVCDEPARQPKMLDALRDLLAAHAEIKDCSHGPTYWLPPQVHLGDGGMRIDETRAAVLQGELAAWRPDIPHEQPFCVALNDGVAASVCASVRKGLGAHEAGVETKTTHRRRGFAHQALSAWAREVRGLKLHALYSTSWENLASQRLATKLGFVCYGAETSLR